MRVRFVGEVGSPFIRRIQEQFPQVVMDDGSVQSDGAVDALVAWRANVSRVEEILRAHHGLAWVHINATGVAPSLLEAMDGHAALLTNGSGVQAPAIAEHVVAVVLAHYRRLRDLQALQERAEWTPSIRLRELRGATVGILGLGNIGLGVAGLLRPFGVRLLGVRRGTDPAPEVDQVYPRAALHDFLAELDVLVIASPLTPETRGMIGRSEFARLPAGAYLVNIARGAIVDEVALIEALTSGHLGGAALDVVTHEPLPATSPLWRLPNVIISPHCSDHTDHTEERGVALLLDNLRRFVNREPLRNVVDRRLGY